MSLLTPELVRIARESVPKGVEKDKLYGIGNFGVISTDGRVLRFFHAACAARLRNDVVKNYADDEAPAISREDVAGIAVYTFNPTHVKKCTGFNRIIDPSPYYHWLLFHPMFTKCFHNPSVKEAVEGLILVRSDIPANLLALLVTLSRYFNEFPGMVFTMGELIKQGIDADVAFYFAHKIPMSAYDAHHLKKKSPYNGNHTVYDLCSVAQDINQLEDYLLERKFQAPLNGLYINGASTTPMSRLLCDQIYGKEGLFEALPEDLRVEIELGRDQRSPFFRGPQIVTVYKEEGFWPRIADAVREACKKHKLPERYYAN